MDLQRDAALPEDVERVRRLALAEEDVSVVEVHVAGAAGEELELGRSEPGEERHVGEDLFKPLDHRLP